MFACVPQSGGPLGAGDGQDWEVFVDAAPEDEGFRIGVVGEKGFYRSQRCPSWIRTLQQAKLFAVCAVAKIVAYKGVRCVRIGSDSIVARAQINALRASVATAQQ